MIRHESAQYRIEQCSNTPLPFALDFKQRDGKHVHLINIGWYRTFEEASAAKVEHLNNPTTPNRETR